VCFSVLTAFPALALNSRLALNFKTLKNPGIAFENNMKALKRLECS